MPLGASSDMLKQIIALVPKPFKPVALPLLAYAAFGGFSGKMYFRALG